MTPIKLVIVAGIGGARADFVAGWLGLLPMFVNSRWTLDPETGVSYGFQGNCRAIDQQQSISQVLSSQGCTLDQNAKFTWAVACHGYDLKPENYLPHIDQGTIKFVSINTKGVDPKIIHWEDLNNVVLKDGILTLDFQSNKVLQFETDELDDEDEEEVTEEEFNAFCQLCLLKNA